MEPENDTAPRRMRLGTKSCAECRRRKVRCVFLEGRQACQGCRLHQTVCRPQEPKKSVADPAAASQLQARLDRLESLMRDLQKTPNPADSTNAGLDIESIVRQTLDRVSASSPGESLPSEDLHTPGGTVSASSDGANPSLDHDSGLLYFQDAPLVALLRDFSIDPVDVESKQQNASHPETERLSLYRQMVKGMLPQHDALTGVLAMTQLYWSLWPSALDDPKRRSTNPSEVVASVRKALYQHIESNNPAMMAKGIVWLTLCLQQIPRDFEKTTASLPARPKNLIRALLRQSDALLSLEAESGACPAALECLHLQIKCYINMGRPRSAWLSVRRGMDVAILLGFHRPHRISNVYHRGLWTKSWQFDRQISLFLGLPYQIPEQHPGLSEEYEDDSIESRVLHRIVILSGRLIDRNQNFNTASYASVVKLEQDLEELREMMPARWWTPSPDIPIAVAFTYAHLKAYYYKIQMLLHLPYMLRALSERKYEHSRFATFEAADGLITAYSQMRAATNGSLVVCDLLDFLAFSAGMVIVMYLISRPTVCVQGDNRGWGLVRRLAADLRCTATILECSVALQAAQTLENMDAARHGVYYGPSQYEVIIPYFGRVRMYQPPPLTPGAESRSRMEVFQASPELQPDYSSIIDLGSNILPCPNPSASDYNMDLGMEWVPNFDTDVLYDWNGVFVDFNMLPK